jgi:hypothetical protein
LFYLEIKRTVEGSSDGAALACRIEDLGPDDFVKVDCSVCDRTALLAPAFLFRVGLEPRDKVLDLRGRVRCRGYGVRGRAVIGIKWAKSAA